MLQPIPVATFHPHRGVQREPLHLGAQRALHERLVPRPAAHTLVPRPGPRAGRAQTRQSVHSTWKWLNSRGVVAKFFRDALKLRVLDAQECPAADLAICSLVVTVLRALCEERWCSLAAPADLPTEELAHVLWRVAKDGDEAVKEPSGLLLALEVSTAPQRAIDVWRKLASGVVPGSEVFGPAVKGSLETILTRGPLARRMFQAIGTSPVSATIAEMQEELCACLRAGVMFRA